MMLSAMISLALSVLALTSATPLSTRGSCKPDFGGPPGFEVSIVNKVLNKEWGLPPGTPGSGTKIVVNPASFANAEFVVRHLPSGEYSIKPILFPGLRVTAPATTGGKLRTVAVNPTDNAQFWNIRCSVCESTPTVGPFDLGCTIESVAHPFQCASLSGSTLSLQPCNGGSKQKFEFGGA